MIRRLLEGGIKTFQAQNAEMESTERGEEKMDEELRSVVADEKATATNGCGCTQCGRAWPRNYRFCGACGNHVVPLDQLKTLAQGYTFGVDPVIKSASWPDPTQ